MNAFCSMMVGLILVYLRMLRRYTCSRPSRADVGSKSDRHRSDVGSMWPVRHRWAANVPPDTCDPTDIDVNQTGITTWHIHCRSVLCSDSHHF
jgi:hypothetical protein